MRFGLATLAAGLGAALVVACGGGAALETDPIRFERIAAAWATGHDLQANYVLRSDAEWHAVWLLHDPQTTPRTEPPQVDFSRSMIVGLTRGTGPNGCFGLAIDRVVEFSLGVEVIYSERRGPPPGPPVGCTQALVPMTDFAIIPRSDKPVIFLPATFP